MLTFEDEEELEQAFFLVLRQHSITFFNSKLLIDLLYADDQSLS